LLDLCALPLLAGNRFGLVVISGIGIPLKQLSSLSREGSKVYIPSEGSIALRGIL
jgi:hypothetical protein